jgi:hypothetical protein
MTNHDDPTLEARVSMRLRRDLDVVLATADADEVARAVMHHGEPRSRTLLVSLAAVLAAAAVTVVGLQFVRPGGGSGAGATPTPTSEVSAIIILDPGEGVQPADLSEEMGRIVQSAWQFAEAHPRDVGYPWVDPATGEIVLSAATDEGQALLEAEAAAMSVPYRFRQVQYSFDELMEIQHQATSLRKEGVPGADLIWASYPDYRDNRTVIRITHMNEELLAELAARYGGDAIAIEVLDGAPEA